MPVRRVVIFGVFLVLILWGSTGVTQTRSGRAKSLEVDPVRILKKTAVIHASREAVWRAFTTADGAKTFFAPGASVGLRAGGPYEMYFDPAAPEGSRGGEGLKVRSFREPEVLSVDWSCPPSLPTIRPIRTIVYFQFRKKTDKLTEVTLTHLGWGVGPEWDQAYQYFDKAWDLVLARLEHHFTVGPIDWKNPWRPGSH